MKLGLAFFLLFACHAQAATYYLMSRCADKQPPPPYPFNPKPQAPAVLVTQDTWLVDDRAFSTNAALKKLDVESVRTALAEHVQQEQTKAAWRALTNPPALKALPQHRPPFQRTNWISPDIFDTNVLTMMETASPGFLTNFSKEYLSRFTNTPPATNTGRPQQLPDRINKSNPNWKQELEQWKEQHPAERKASGGGDYIYPWTAFYQLTMRPIPARQPLTCPVYDSTNGFTWPPPKPSFTQYGIPLEMGGLSFTTQINSLDLMVVHLADWSELFLVIMRYPDEVGLEGSLFPTCDVNLWGECSAGSTFDVTNTLALPAGGVYGSWLLRPRTACFEFNPGFSSVDVIAFSYDGPSVPLWDWNGIRQDYPRLQPPVHNPPLFPTMAFQALGAGFTPIVVQAVSDLGNTNWATVATLTTGAEGVGETQLEVTNSAQFFRVYNQQ